jgi:peptide/nickel transport system ATP-binding protein
MSLIWITHDLAVVAGLADKICVMYAGKVVEAGTIEEVIDRPLHPYTHGLIGSVPSHNKRGQPLDQIPGMTPSLLNMPQGCSFHPRCPRADAQCLVEPTVTTPGQPNHSVRCCHPHLEDAA